MSLETKFKFDEIIFDLSKVSHPRIRKVIKSRVHDGEQFLFRYGDYDDHTDKSNRYSEYTECKYGDHSDHNDNHTDWSGEETSHTDSTGNSGRYWNEGHTDQSTGTGHVGHTDTGYSEGTK